MTESYEYQQPYFIIKCKFVGNDDTYNLEEENATTEEYANMKYRRMLKKWYAILTRNTEDVDNENMLHQINQYIKLNPKCRFTISCTKIEPSKCNWVHNSLYWDDMDI